LYEDLRCSILHVILPGSQFKLIQRTEKIKFDANHLEVKEILGMDRLILVLEDLFDDYEKACKEVIVRISDGRLKGWKFEGDLWSTS
jgi:CRISPR/Cas system CMR subunit Cmr4 (Cas7 group RAMP superfamily)